jgi:glutamine amidotransferase
MYFVHSYYVAPKNKKDILTETYYSGLKYTSSVLKNNIFACQFHPEKSAQEGIKVYKNWALLNNLY